MLLAAIRRCCHELVLAAHSLGARRGAGDAAVFDSLGGIGPLTEPVNGLGEPLVVLGGIFLRTAHLLVQCLVGFLVSIATALMHVRGESIGS